jgi:hypothetical protein
MNNDLLRGCLIPLVSCLAWSLAWLVFLCLMIGG